MLFDGRDMMIWSKNLVTKPCRKKSSKHKLQNQMHTVSVPLNFKSKSQKVPFIIFLRILNQKIIRLKIKFFDIQCCDYINFFPCIWILNLKVKKSLFRISISLAIFKFDCDISDLIRHALLFNFRLIDLYLEIERPLL